MKRSLEVVSIIAVASMFVMLAVVYRGSPDQIPNHFNTGAQPMRSIGKGSLWILPLISLNLFVFLSAASYFAPRHPGASAMPLVAAKAAVMTGLACLYFLYLP